MRKPIQTITDGDRMIIRPECFDSPIEWIEWLEREGRPLDTKEVVWTVLPKGTDLKQYKKEHPNARIISTKIIAKEETK